MHEEAAPSSPRRLATGRLTKFFSAPLSGKAKRARNRVAELRAGIRVEDNFRWLYEKYYRPIMVFFGNRGFSAVECEDLTHEVFVRVYKDIGKFRGDASFNTWLYRIVRNTWLKKIRYEQAGMRAAQEVPLEKMTESGELAAVDLGASTTGSDPQRRLLDRERRDLLRRAVDDLPHQMRRCLLLRLGGGLKYKEIAELMQISIDAVKSHLGQGKVRLDRKLKEIFREDLSETVDGE